MKKDHPKLCQCNWCARQRAHVLKVRYATEYKTPRMPERPDQLVMVRAHFRRHPGYLRKDPALLKFWQGFVKGLIE